MSNLCMRRHIHTCVYMCILMYICGEYVAHLYMIVLVMNDQTKLKQLCFFACKRPMADGRQTKISDHLWNKIYCEKYQTGTPMYNKIYCEMCGTVEQKNDQPPYPHTPASMLWKLLQAFWKMTTLKLGHGDSNAALRMLTTRLRAAWWSWWCPGLFTSYFLQYTIRDTVVKFVAPLRQEWV